MSPSSGTADKSGPSPPVPGDADDPGRGKARGEVVFDLIGMGIVLAVYAGLIYFKPTWVRVPFETGQNLNGTAFACILVFSVWHAACGAVLIYSKSFLFAYFGASGSALLSIGYFWLTATTAGIPFDLLTIFMLLMPLFIWWRVFEAVRR